MQRVTFDLTFVDELEVFFTRSCPPAGSSGAALPPNVASVSSVCVRSSVSVMKQR